MAVERILLFTFLITLVVVLGTVALGFAVAGFLRKRDLLRTLRVDRPEQQREVTAVQILLEERKGSKLASALAEITVLKRVQDEIRSAGMDWPIEVFVVSSAAGFTIGATVGYVSAILFFKWASAVILGLALGSIPWIVVQVNKSKRMAAFEEQFPESLDFIARAIRAGHAFSVSLEMLAAESPEPVRSEFRQVFNEVNLGSTLGASLTGLAARVPLVDVRFFVSAVLLQRETGGSLGEVLGKLAHTIRERFRLKGQVQAMTAHARMTALTLTILPIVTLIYMRIRMPRYLEILSSDFHGQIMLVSAFLLQVVGYFIIKSMINFKI